MPEFLVQSKLLIKLGWEWSEGHFDKCRICRQRISFQYGWRSPKYAIYHDHCLANSKRYYSILKRYGEKIPETQYA